MASRLSIAKGFAKEAGARFPQITSVILYGSVARGQDTGDSDIDLLVLTRRKAGIERGLDEMVTDYILEKSELAVPMVYTEKEFKNRDSPFHREVLRDGKVIYTKSGG